MSQQLKPSTCERNSAGSTYCRLRQTRPACRASHHALRPAWPIARHPCLLLSLPIDSIAASCARSSLMRIRSCLIGARIDDGWSPGRSLWGSNAVCVAAIAYDTTATVDHAKHKQDTWEKRISTNAIQRQVLGLPTQACRSLSTTHKDFITRATS